MESVIVQNGEPSGLESVKQKPAEVYTNGKQQNGNNGFDDEFDIICLDEAEQIDLRVQEASEKHKKEQKEKPEQKQEPEVIEIDDFELSFDVEEPKETPKRSKRIKDKEIKEIKNKEAKKSTPAKEVQEVKEKKESPKVEKKEEAKEQPVSDLLERINSSGRRLSGRRPLRGLISPHPATKRKAEDNEERDAKRCKTPSTESPGWRYYASPSSLFLKFKESLTPSRGKAISSDDSMAVNFDDTIAQSPLDDSQFEADLQEKPKTWKTCNIM